MIAVVRWVYISQSPLFFVHSGVSKEVFDFSGFDDISRSPYQRSIANEGSR